MGDGDKGPLSNDDAFRDRWVAYPMGLFVAALRSIVGGFIVVLLALCVGTWCGELAYWGMEAESVVYVPLLAFGMLALAVLQVWGWLILLLIGWLLYRLIHEEGSRVLAFVMLVPIQATVTILGLWQAENWWEWKWDQVVRVAVAYLLFAGVGWALWSWRRIILRQFDQGSSGAVVAIPPK